MFADRERQERMEKDIVIYLGAMVMPEGNAGAQRTVSICKCLIELGYQPVVIGLTYDENVPSDILKTKKEYKGITYYEIKYPRTLQEWAQRMLDVKKFIQVIDFYGVNRIHSVIAIDYEMIALYRLYHYCNRNHIHLIADSMEWYEKSTLPFPMSIAKDLDTYIRMHFLYRKIPNAICISHYLFNYHKKIYPQKNAAVIPVTVDLQDEKWKQVENSESRGDNTRTLVYAGNPGNGFIKERLDWLVNTVLELNRMGTFCKLKVIGITKEWYLSQISGANSVSDTKALEKCVIFCGMKAHRECLEEIKASDFFVIAREDRLVTRAGFPTKLSEGLACGIPVITTPSSDIAAYLKGKDFAFISDGFAYEDFKETVNRAIKLDDAHLCLAKEHAKEYTGLDYRTFTSELAGFWERLK